MKIEVKNLKTSEFNSPDSLCFQATIYVDGVRAFVASNDGYGGCNFYHPVDDKGKGLLTACEAWAKSLPAIKYQEMEIESDLDIVLSDMIESILSEKKMNQFFRNKCKKYTLFRLPEDREDEYRTIKHLYDTAVKKFILNKYPDAIIINEGLK